MPVAFEINGTTYLPRLSLKGVEMAERVAGKGYGYLLLGALDEGRVSDLLTLATAVLQPAWPGVTPEALWEALAMSDPAQLPAATERLRTMLLALLIEDLPDTPEGDAKNA